MISPFKYIPKLTRIGFAIIIIGVLFKILHWQGANLIFMIGCVSTVILQLWELIKIKVKTVQDYLVSIIIVSFIPHYMLKVLHWPNSVILLYISGIALLAIASINVFKTSKELASEGTEGKRLTYVYVIGFFQIVLGIIFKILHWPGANLMLIIGLGLFAFFIIYDLFKRSA